MEEDLKNEGILHLLLISELDEPLPGKIQALFEGPFLIAHGIALRLGHALVERLDSLSPVPCFLQLRPSIGELLLQLGLGDPGDHLPHHDGFPLLHQESFQPPLGVRGDREHPLHVDQDALPTNLDRQG